MGKKSIFKLSEDAPTQHLLLLGVVGVIIFLSIIDAIKSPSLPEDDQVRAIKPGQSRYVNPEMNWYEKIFCRGYQRSIWCQNRFLHPLRSKFEAEDKVIKEGPPESDGVIIYRGYLKGEKQSFGGKIELNLSHD